MLSLPKMLIVSEDAKSLNSYRRLFYPYAAVEAVFGYRAGMANLLQEQQPCAVIMTCCDLLGPRDRDLLQQAQKFQPNASRIVLVDSYSRHKEHSEAVDAIRYERSGGDAKALQEVLMSALMEHRLTCIASSMRQN